MRHITRPGDLDTLFAENLAVLYKHSPTCGVCSAAAGEVNGFLRRHPGAVLYRVDVLAARSLSQEIAARTGIEHESPQIIILRSGAPVWNTSHYAITADTLAGQYEAALAGSGSPGQPVD